jgi:hypothetical protein
MGEAIDSVTETMSENGIGEDLEQGLRQLLILSENRRVNACAERDAAIRDRDALQTRVAHLEDANRATKDAADTASGMVDELRARVAELEAAKIFADQTEARLRRYGEWESVERQRACEERDTLRASVAELEAAQFSRTGQIGQRGGQAERKCTERDNLAASGGGEECVRVKWSVDDSFARAKMDGMDVRPLRRPQPRGWLTEEERDGLGQIAIYFDTRADCSLQGLGSMVRVLLARSSPPVVVLDSWREAAGEVVSLDDVRLALAAIGVPVKEAR